MFLILKWFSRNFALVVGHSDLPNDNKQKLIDRLDECADKCYKIVDKFLDLDVTTSLSIKSFTQSEEISGALIIKSMVFVKFEQLERLKGIYI